MQIILSHCGSSAVLSLPSSSLSHAELCTHLVQRLLAKPLVLGSAASSAASSSQPPAPSASLLAALAAAVAPSFKFSLGMRTLRPSSPPLSCAAQASAQASGPLVVTASLFQPLLGGKGGFGALLKAAAGKAGAKKTTDFGACRDLNGRRLRHVNDEVKLSRWKRNKELEADGKEALDETTESGIENWHLGTPTWAGGQSNKEAYRAAKRKRVDKKKATEKKARLADEAERKKSSEDGLVSAYMGDYDSQVGGSEANNDDLTNVVMKEMRRKKDAKALAKQLAGVWGENGLMDVTGGGEVLWKKGGLVKGGGGGSGKDAKPVFSTVFAPGARLRPDDGKVYFEAVIQQSAAKEPAPTQLGVLDQGNLPSATEDDGVGDVKNSFAWDGGRGQLLAEGEEVEGAAGVEWAAGDVIGVLWDRGSVSYSLNGVVLTGGEEGEEGGVGFAGIGAKRGTRMTPALSLNSGEVVRLRLGGGVGDAVDGFEFCPAGFKGVAALLGRQEDEDEDDEEDGEGEGEGAAAAAATTTTTTTTTSVTANMTFPPAAPAPAPALANPAADAVPLTVENIKQQPSAEALAKLPMGVLKVTLEALGLKAGGSAKERAERVWHCVRVVEKREDIPNKMRNKATFDAITKFL